MKRILSGVLALLILLLAITGCSPNNKLLSEEDFNVYRDGKLFMDINDVKNKSIYLDPDSETFRGLKLNDTVTKVKELYGNESTYIKVKETNCLEKMSVAEFIRIVTDDNYQIQFEKIYIDGKLYDLKQAAEFPAGTKYMCKMLSIRVNGAYVSEIRLDYGQFTLTEEAKKSFAN